MKANQLSQIMKLAWQFAKQTGLEFSECLKKAWANFKLVNRLKAGIVRFYFQKIDGTIREAWGTLKNVEAITNTVGTNKRAKSNTVQVYFDTEKQEFRCFKKLNLIY